MLFSTISQEKVDLLGFLFFFVFHSDLERVVFLNKSGLSVHQIALMYFGVLRCYTLIR